MIQRSLFKFLVRRHRISILLSLLLPISIGVAMGFLYPLLAPHRAALSPLVKSMRGLIRMDVDIIDFFSAEGAFNVPFQHPMTFLVMALVGCIPALALPAGERGRGSLALLLATPLSRVQLILTISVFALPGAVLAGMAPFVGSIIGASIAGELMHIPLSAYACSAVNASAASVFMAGVSLLISVCSEDRAVATRRLILLMAVFYLLDFVARVSPKTAWVGFLTPLGYYDSTGLLTGTAFLARDLSVLIGLGFFLMASAALVEHRRRSA